MPSEVAPRSLAQPLNCGPDGVGSEVSSSSSSSSWCPSSCRARARPFSLEALEARCYGLVESGGVVLEPFGEGESVSLRVDTCCLRPRSWRPDAQCRGHFAPAALLDIGSSYAVSRFRWLEELLRSSLVRTPRMRGGASPFEERFSRLRAFRRGRTRTDGSEFTPLVCCRSVQLSAGDDAPSRVCRVLGRLEVRRSGAEERPFAPCRCFLSW